MNLLFISTTFPDASSPARGTYNAALCRSLAKSHTVQVIAPRMFSEAWKHRGPFELPSDLAAAGVQADYPTYWYTPKVLQHCYGDQMWWSIRSCLRRVLDRFQPDAVLSYFAHPDGQVGQQAAELCGVPSAVIVGGTDVLVLPQQRRRGAAVRRVLERTTRVMTVSEGLRQRCLALGCQPDQVQTIYQGIDPQVFHAHNRAASRRKLGLSDDEQVLLWVGRMVPIKGLDLLLNACTHLKKSNPRARLHLLGDGPSRRDLEQRTTALGLNDVVQFHGAVGHDHLADWYRAADASVLTSLSEGLPNVFREALACGTPFVSTDVGSIREIADPAYARCVTGRDPLEFAQAVQDILQPEYREAAEMYAPRTWDDCAAEVVELLSPRSTTVSAKPVPQVLSTGR